MRPLLLIGVRKIASAKRKACATGYVSTYCRIFDLVRKFHQSALSPFSGAFIIIMRPTAACLLFLFYTARTICAAAIPKHLFGLLASFSEGDALPTIRSNATLGLAFDASLLLNASDFAITCFIASPHLRSIPKIDYYEAVEKILIRDDALVPKRFELGPGGRGRRNFLWRGGDCDIDFFNPEPLRTDAFPIILIAHVAALIADECLTEAKGYLGGHSNMGPTRGVVSVINPNPLYILSDKSQINATE